MKRFNNLNEILAFELEGMHVAEKLIQSQLPECIKSITSKKLKLEFTRYRDSAGDKRLKLKRIFSYLLTRPADRKSKPIVKMIEEIKAIALSSTPRELKDSQFLSALQRIAHYKMAVYTTARQYARELDLDVVSDLLSEMITWENETCTSLQRMALGGIHQEAALLSVL